MSGNANIALIRADYARVWQEGWNAYAKYQAEKERSAWADGLAGEGWKVTPPENPYLT